MTITTLRPGLLVSLHTSLEGGVSYTRVDLAKNKEEGEATIEQWETTKVTQDPEEHTRAAQVRSKASSLIRSVCAPSAFGLLCPVSREKDLDVNLVIARSLVDAFNSTAKTCRVGIYVLKGRIAESDSEAARAINGELRGLLDEMQTGITNSDVKAIRDAAARAKRMGAMLDASVGLKVSAAIEEARNVAREIVKKATEKGADVAAYVQSVQLKAIEEARFSFLDLEEPTAKAEGAALDVANARVLDMDAAEPEPSEEREQADALMESTERDEREYEASCETQEAAAYEARAYGGRFDL